MDSRPDNNGVDLQRSLILETVKESYLLSPSVDSPELGEGRKYDICLILEKEVVVEVDPVLVADGEHPLVVVDDVVMGDVVVHQAEVVQGLAAQTESTTLEGQPTEAISSSGSGMEDVDSKTEDGNSKTETPSHTVEPLKNSQLPAIGATSPHSTESSLHPPASTDPSHVPSTSSAPEDHSLLPPPTIAAVLDSSIVPSKENEKVPPPPPPHQPVQVLQRNLTESMFRFTWEGVKIVERSSDDGVETEWAIQVCNWKWAPALR